MEICIICQFIKTGAMNSSSWCNQWMSGLCVYFGAVHWYLCEAGCLGDRSLKPKGACMIGRNVPLIFSWVPCLSLLGMSRVAIRICFPCLEFIHVYIFCINEEVKAVLFLPPGVLWRRWACDERLSNWVFPLSYCDWFLFPPKMNLQFKCECLALCHYNDNDVVLKLVSLESIEKIHNIC